MESSIRVLLIEPDAARAAICRDVLRLRLEAELVIVKGIEEALRSLAEEIPELVLTSTFLAPADEALLTARLKELPGAAHVQVINAPYFLDVDRKSPEHPTASKVLEFLGLRAAAGRPRCDVKTFQEQVEQYLDQAAAIRVERSQFQHAAVHLPARTMLGPWLPQPGATGTSGRPSDLLKADPGRDRRRARRRSGSDVPSLWSVRLPWGDAIRIVNISTSGVLLESKAKASPGTTMDLRLVGEGTDLVLPARTIRADIAHVDTFGVKYHLAAAFSREIILPGADLPQGADPSASPGALSSLLTRILADVEHPQSAPELLTRFESDLRQLFRLRDAQIRETPVIPDEMCESIYFTIPQRSGEPRILQVVFEPGRVPSEMDFRLLKAAASAAALVLEFARLLKAAPGGSRFALGLP